ncbi:hypothetical protein [Streptomyces sp. NPDC058297]|uniref:hypothetical protein n=1 Tax=Streptomyces sp. NPDC058297 TaxID=3346433 RepID=UPI0036EC3AE0
MRALRVPRPLGRPRIRPVTVLADKAYSSRVLRAHLRRRGSKAVIPIPRRPASPPQTARQPRRQTARLRPRGVQAAQCSRTPHQPSEEMARRRHPLREDRHGRPGRAPPRRHLPLVRTLIRSARPSITCHEHCDRDCRAGARWLLGYLPQRCATGTATSSSGARQPAAERLLRAFVRDHGSQQQDLRLLR